VTAGGDFAIPKAFGRLETFAFGDVVSRSLLAFLFRHLGLSLEVLVVYFGRLLPDLECCRVVCVLL
jgi:hypothetical protein